MRSMLWERNAYACGGHVAVLCGVRIITGLQALYRVRRSKLQAFCGVDSQHTLEVFVANWPAGQEQELPADKCNPR